jgi:hypothetical protein
VASAAGPFATKRKYHSFDPLWLAQSVTRLIGGQPVVLFLIGARICLFSKTSRPVLGPIHPPTHGAPGVPYQGVKRPRREPDHSPPWNALVKNKWSCASTPLYAFMVCIKAILPSELTCFLTRAENISSQTQSKNMD